jgi:hypothetical protein
MSIRWISDVPSKMVKIWRRGQFPQVDGLAGVRVSARIQHAGFAGWLPVRAENLYHQAILMNHALGAVAPPDTEVVQVGDTIWQRGSLVQGAVRPVRVIEVLVFAQDAQP